MAKITVVFNGQNQAEYTLSKAEHTVGRAADSDIVVDNLGVSRHHCSIVKDGEGWVVVDSGSNNGTYVGGQRITRHALKHGDKIVLGKHSLVFDAAGVASAASAPPTKKAAAMGGEMTMFVDQAALAKAIASDGGRRMALAVIQGGREVLVPLLKDETTIGKAGDIPIGGFLVKPIQAKIMKVGDAHRIVAMGGWRAVKVNGQKLAGEMPLKEGDVILIAGSTMSYRKA